MRETNENENAKKDEEVPLPNDREHEEPVNSLAQ